MIKYKKTNDLKTDILNVAAIMFREYGYHNTTFQKIADELDITKGAITYHYKNKHLIVRLLIEEYYATIKEFIRSYPESYINSFWKYCVLYIYAYRELYKSKRNLELFYHKKQVDLWTDSVVDIVSRFYMEIADDFHKNLTEEICVMNAHIDLGARVFMHERYVANPEIYTMQKLLYYHLHAMGYLSRLDEKTVQYAIRMAYAFADSHEPPVTRIFKDNK